MAEPAPVHCACGELLFEELPGDRMRLGDKAYRLRRTTDFVACPGCGFLHRATDLAAGYNGPSDLLADPAKRGLHDLVAELALTEDIEDVEGTVGPANP